MFPGKGSQARFPGTESEARLLGRGSQARFPGNPCSWKPFAWEPALSGNACLRTCSCEPCSCLEPCLETVPGTLLRNRFWEPYLQAVPKNLTLLGKLFLDTCLEASSWKLAWERFSPTAYVSLGSAATPRTRFPIKFSRNRLQARLPGTIPKNRFPGKVPKQGFQIQLPSKVPRNMFPSKVPRNRFPRKGCKKGSKE